MDNGDDHATEVYYSNGGELNLDTNKITPAGGLTRHFAEAMQMQANLLPSLDLSSAEKVVTSANTGGDSLTSAHIRNWMECVRSRKQPHAPVEAGYSHSIANIMTNAAVHTGVMADGKVFLY
jgi:hypothetical protein